MKVWNLQLAQRFLYTDGSCARSRPVMQTVVRKLFPSCDAMTNMASFPVRKVIYCMVKRACTCTANHLFATGDFFLAQRAGSPRIATHDHNYPFNYATVADFKWSGTRNSSLVAHSETSCSSKPDLLVRSHCERWVISNGICCISKLFNLYYIQENIITNSNITIGYWISFR